MSDADKNIDRLHEKLNLLLKKQEAFQDEINRLKHEIDSLSTQKAFTQKNKPATLETGVIVSTPEKKDQAKVPDPPLVKPTTRIKVPSFTIKQSLEKFIGENLINKIGIIITVIGVAIGAKYSIERQLINPLTRIILGYAFGITLLVFAIRLKKRYEPYSAVLVSGAMAILYFITFAAYDLYGLITQLTAFVLMVAFTVFTVFAAIQYDRQIIGVIGLVGAYAVPFLLSDGSGSHIVLLTYITIINTGILIIAFKKHWKPLYYSAFSLTWLIFTTWYIADFDPQAHMAEGLAFSLLFFIIFYLSFLAYKLAQNEKYSVSHVAVLLSNSFIYFLFGYNMLGYHESSSQFLGLFTLGNAIIHFVVSTIVYRKKLADRNLFYFVSGLVLVFITIAIPIQLDGNWVTILWVCEAALLFWIGRTKRVTVYEQLSYPLMILGFISLTDDWFDRSLILNYVPVFNIQFLSSLIFMMAMGFINRINFYKKYALKPENLHAYRKLFNFTIPGMLVFALYGSLLLEVMAYFDQQYVNSLIEVKLNQNGSTTSYYDRDIPKFKAIWMMNYTLLFVSLLCFINVFKIKNQTLKLVNISTGAVMLIIFLTGVLTILGNLRESYLQQYLGQYYERGIMHLSIRYVSIGFLALLLVAGWKQLHECQSKPKPKIVFEIIVHLTIVWVLSSELFHWMDLFAVKNIYKLGLSILWGVYALLLVVLGIWKSKKYLRMVGIVLFAITLCKLFFYDIAQLNTIKKTVVFVSLGTLLLIISFLYHKYKDKINEYES